MFFFVDDEVIINAWTNDTEITSYLTETNMTIMELFGNSVFDMQSHIQSHNRTVMVWQKMLLPQNFILSIETIVQIWIGSSGVKVVTEKGYKTVVSSSDFWYLDTGYGKPRSNPCSNIPGTCYNH